MEEGFNRPLTPIGFYWYCANCDEEVQPERVTVDEKHEKIGCYRPVALRKENK